MKTECSKKVIGYKIKNLTCEKYGEDCFLVDRCFTAFKEEAEIYPISVVETVVSELRSLELKLRLPYKQNYDLRIFPVWGDK